MSKKGRAQNRARRNSPERWKRELLLTLEALGRMVGTQASCQSASSDFLYAAQELGFTGRLQAVHTAAVLSPPNEEPLLHVTSETARQHLGTLGYAIGNTPAQEKWAGHVVVILDSPHTLWDANFGQFLPLQGGPMSVAGEIAQTAEWWTLQPTRTLVVHYKAGPPQETLASFLAENAEFSAASGRAIAQCARQGRVATETDLMRSLL
jgi:hypothetical protein